MRSFVLAVLMILLGADAWAQSDSLVNGEFTNLTFSQFAKRVERNTYYRFYFDPKQTDSVTVVLDVRNEHLEGVLNKIFAGTNFHYAIDAGHRVFVVKAVQIQTGLLTTGAQTDTRNQLRAEDWEQDQKEKTRLLVENKEYDIGKKTAVISPGQATVAGYIRSASTGESIIGAAVYINDPLIGVASDQFGYYAITIPKGKHELFVRSSGMKKALRKITVYGDGKLNIELTDDVITLKEVTVESEKDRNVAGDQMGVQRMDIKTMKKLPVVFGEVDVFKAMLTLPGVQSVGEGTSGLNVRGGATSQNLILFDDATIYNPTHLFGFFSAFNPDVVKNLELYKSSIPAEFGGRLSSVMDVNSREGNKKKFSGAGGIGPVTGRLTLEGPILKNKASFMVGARSTYSDWLLKKIPSDVLRNSEAAFYDLNARLDYDINERNSLYFTGYYSQDRFKLNSDTLYQYATRALTGKWKHSFGNKLYAVLGGGYSGYQYRISSDKNPLEAFRLLYQIRQTNAKLDLSYFPAPRHVVNAGGNIIDYTLSPGSKYRPNPNLEDPNDIVPDEHGIESALYIGDHFEATPRLSIYVGIRYSMYSYRGPHDVAIYAAGEPRSPTSVIDTVHYPAGKSIATYHGPEYRLSIKYSLGDFSSLKISYNKTRQYIQMLSNTTAISPTDIWKLSDSYVKPQVGDQFSFGYYQNFNHNTIEASVETYYKTMANSIDYKGGAKLLLNHNIETDILNAQGKAYGVEFMIKKTSGKLNGWVTYTYARSLLRTQGDNPTETVNNGVYYPSNYDKPNAFNFVGNYRFSHRYSSSVSMTYSTGRPITAPIAKYQLEGSYRTLYGPRNGDRIPDYFRIDLSINIEGSHKIKKLAHSSWTIGVYNLTGRRNAYSVFYESKNGQIKGYKLSVLGSAIPTVTYNFKF